MPMPLDLKNSIWIISDGRIHPLPYEPTVFSGTGGWVSGSGTYSREFGCEPTVTLQRGICSIRGQRKSDANSATTTIRTTETRTIREATPIIYDLERIGPGGGRMKRIHAYIRQLIGHADLGYLFGGWSGIKIIGCERHRYSVLEIQITNLGSECK